VYQSDSPQLDVKFRSEILQRFDRDKDTYRHKKVDNEGDRIDFGVFPYEHSRAMPKELARKAHLYIRSIVQGDEDRPGFPFQLRYLMALPLWDRFCEEWCATGDEAKALGAI